MSKLTHFDDDGAARMVGVGKKPETERTAVAEARVRMQPETLEMIRAGTAKKGDVLGVARLAGIQAAKRTADLIPLCHPLRLTSVDVSFEVRDTPAEVVAKSTVRAVDRTGVEMEALTAASVACLTIYDMVKAVDRGMEITDLRLLEKSGGASGDWKRAPA